MALSTYTTYDLSNSAPNMNGIDSAVGSAPTDRPSMFTPPGGYPTLTTTIDYGVGSTPTKRPTTFENASVLVSIDPGLAVSS